MRFSWTAFHDAVDPWQAPQRAATSGRRYSVVGGVAAVLGAPLMLVLGR